MFSECKNVALRTNGLTLYTPTHNMVKHTHTIRRLLPFDHVVGLALKALMQVNYQLSLIELNVWDHSKNFEMQNFGH